MALSVHKKVQITRIIKILINTLYHKASAETKVTVIVLHSEMISN